MKIRILLIALLCSVGLSAAAQNTAGKAKLTFKNAEHDFKTITDKAKVTCDFEFVNEGSCPLVITKAMVSCKCISIDYSKKPIAPGAKGTISVTYNPKKQQGVFFKAIQVYSNDPVERRIITVKGKVVAEK